MMSPYKSSLTDLPDLCSFMVSNRSGFRGIRVKTPTT